MEEKQWRNEFVALDAPPTVQTSTTQPAPVKPPQRRIPWKWVIIVIAFIFSLVAGLIILRSFVGKNSSNSSQSQGTTKSQDVDLGNLADVATPLKVDKTDKVVINGLLETNQGLVINPTGQPAAAVLGQIYVDSATRELRFYNGQDFQTLATQAGSLSRQDVLNLIGASGLTLPQDLSKTASPQFTGMTLTSVLNVGGTIIQGASGGSSTFTLPSNAGSANQCLITNGSGVLSFAACASGSGNAFLQGGNAFATAANLGTTDANSLSFLTNNTARMTITSSGNVGINNASSNNKLAINSPSTADNGAQLLVAAGLSTNKGIVIQGEFGQTGSLVEAQDYNGSALFTVGGDGTSAFRTGTNSTTGFQVQNAAGTSVLNVDTTNQRVGIGYSNPSYKLDVNGDVNIVGTSALRIGGAVICTSSGCSSSGSSGFYIQNTTGIQSNANFAIQSANAGYVAGVIRGASGQTANLLNIQVSNGSNVLAVGATGAVTSQNSANSTTAFQIQDAAGTSNLFIADTTNTRIGIGIAPSYTLDVNGDINIAGANSLRIGGTVICDSTGCDSGSGSGFYIQNGTGVQSNANFAIQSANSGYVGGIIRGAASQTADLLQLQNSSGTNLFSVSASGSVISQNSTDSTGAFRVLDAAGTSNVLVVDTTNKRVGINTYPTGYALDVNGDVNLTPSNGSLRISGTVVCSLSGCAASSGSGNYIQNGNGIQTNGNFAIQSANIGYVGGLIRGASGQTADIFQAQNSSASNLFRIGATGATTLQNSADSTAAFNINNSGGTTLFSVDTQNGTTNATNLTGNAIVGTTSNSSSYGVVGTQTAGVGGGVRGVGGGGYGVFGQSASNASGYFQTTDTSGLNTVATLISKANTNQASNLLEIQSSAGSSNILLGVDVNGNIISSSNIIRVNGTNSAELQAWSSTTASQSASRKAHSTVITNGFIYNIAGITSGSTITGSVDYAPISANGDVGSWTSTTQLVSGSSGVPRAYAGAVAHGGFIYVVGGYDNADTVSTSVFYNRINADGSLGSTWAQAENKLSVGLAGASLVVSNGYLYVMGGASSLSASIASGGTPTGVVSTGNIQYAKINADGSVGAFNATTISMPDPDGGGALTSGFVGGRAIVANGYIYYVGGQDSSLTARNLVYYTRAATSGDITTSWTQANSLTNSRAYHGVAVQNGYLYAYGGGANATTASATGTVEYADFGSSGALGTWATSSQNLATSTTSFGYGSSNGYLYAVAGSNSSGSSLTSSQYTTGSRVYASSLDLVGLGGDMLGSGGTGGTLTAGNTTIAGRLSVSDTATFLQNASVIGNLSVGGQAAFKNETDSTNAFSVQNASGSSVLLIDTAGALINPGFSSSTTTQSRTVTQTSTQANDHSTASTTMVLGGDGKAIISALDSTNSKFITQKCLDTACVTGVTIVSHNSPISSTNAYGTHNSVAISKVDGLPIIGVRDNTANRLTAIKCGTHDCSSGNRYVSTATTNTGLYVSTLVSSDGIPLFFYKNGASSDLAVMPCTNTGCTALGAQSTLSDSDNLGNNVVSTLSQDEKPIIVSQNLTGTDTLKVTKCPDTLCSTWTGATTNTISYGANNIGDYNALAVPSDGRPVIATIDTTSATNDILVFKCNNDTCSSYGSPVNVSSVFGTGNSASSLGMAIGADDLPILTFKRASHPTMYIVKCGNSTCSSGNTNTSIVGGGATSFGNVSNVTIGNDGFPLIVSNAGPTNGTNYSRNLAVTHCVDPTCSVLSASVRGGGVNLGSKALPYSGVYTDTINEGRDPKSAPLRVTSDKTVFANAFSSDADGNVKISSISSTAFQVQNADTSEKLLSIDMTNSAVNLGTATSVSGYGFQSTYANLFRNTTNSTSQFAIQNASSSSLFNLDSSNNRVNLFSALSAITTPTPTATKPNQNGTPTVTPTGTTGATNYSYIIEAVTTIGNSAASVAGTTATGNATLSSSNYNALSWTAFTPSSGSTLYYNIYRTVGGSTTGLIATTSSTTFNDTGYTGNGASITAGGSLAASTTYYYKITAIDSAGGESAASAETSVATDGTLRTIDLTWTGVTSAIGYKVYRSTTTNAEVYLTTVLGNTFTDKGTITAGSTSPPSSNSAYTSTNNANSLLQMVIGGNGTPTGQLYVSGINPTSALSSTTAGSDPNWLAVQGRYTYVTNQTSATLQIFDTNNPRSPVSMSTISTGTLPRAVVVSGRYAYVVNQTSNTMQIFDISNPSSPSLVSTTTTGIGPLHISVQGRYAYIPNATSNTLQIFDINNPASPVSVGTVATGTLPRWVAVQGRYAYLTNFTSNSIQVIDVGNPASPSVVGTLAYGLNAPRGIVVQGRYAYVANSNGNNLVVYDIGNPAVPTYVTAVSAGVTPYAITLSGRYVYVTNFNSSNFQTFDISNPASPFSVGTSTSGTFPNAIAVSGRHVYSTNQGNDTLQIFDIGGTYTQALEAGSAEVSVLNVTTNVTIAGDTTMQGGLNVSGSIQTASNLGVSGNGFIQGTLSVAGGVQGGLTITGISAPSAPTITNIGTAGATTYSYTVTAISATGGESTASSAGTTATGNATLSSTNYNQVNWTPVAGAVNYKVYRTVGGATQGLLATTSSTYYYDQGAAGSGSAPTSNTTGSLNVTGNSLFKPATDGASAFLVQNAAGTSTLLGIDTSNNGTVSIQTVADSGVINIGTVNSGTITIGKSGGSGTLTIYGNTSITGTLTVVGNSTFTGHVRSTQTTAPTIGTPSACGTSPSASVTAGSTDSAGSFTITAGSGSPGNCAVIITFNAAYAAAPKAILLTATGSTAVTKDIYVSGSGTTTFTVTLGTAPAASEANTFNYWVVE